MPVTTTLFSGTTYHAAQVSNTCESISRMPVIANILTPAPTATSATQTLCLAGTVGDLQVTGTNIKWYNAATAGSILTLATALVNNTIYYASQTLNGAESASRVAITVLTNTTPAPTATSPQNVAGNTTLAGLSPVGANIRWYATATGGSALPVTTTLINGTTYHAAQVSNTCESVTRTPVLANVAPITLSSSLNFDGTNDSVSLPVSIGNALSGGTELTIEYWFKGTNVTSAVRIQSGSNYISAGYLDSSGNLKFIVSTDGGVNGVNIANQTAMYGDGFWHHVAYVWKRGATFATYFDGVLSNSRVANGNVNLPVFSNVNMYIGSFNGTAEFSKGNIDDVRIWNRALSACEIATNRNCELSAGQTNLLAYYKFNNGAADGLNTNSTSLADSSGNNQTGTLINFALTSGTSSNYSSLAGVVSGTTCAANGGAPAALATQTVCPGATLSSLTATTIGTIKWYADATTTTPLAATSTLVVGNYFASQIINGCESASRTQVTVAFGSPAAPVATDLQTVCAGATLSSLMATTAGTIKWYADATTTTPLAATSTLVVGNYFASQTINGCESASRTQVTVGFYAPTPAPTGPSSQVYTSGGTFGALEVVGTGIKWYTTQTGGVAIASTTNVAAGTTYYVSQTINGCESASRTAI